MPSAATVLKLAHPGLRQPGVGALFSLTLLVLLALSVQLGAVSVSWRDWLGVFDTPEAMGGAAHVLWNLRLPRALLAMLVGASLGLAGALAQGLFRNPLADPGLLGVTSGAACAAALVLTVFAAAQMAVPASWRMFVLPAAAFTGALAVCFALERTARWLTPGSVSGLLLTGLALNAVAMSIVGLCTYLATDEQLRSLSFWSLGSLAAAQWNLVAVVGVILAIAAQLAGRMRHSLNALALGEAAAAHVGVDVPRLRTRLITIIALLSAVSVAWCGVIGFIGLMAPHLVRGLAGADQRRVVPLAMGAGAILLLVADTVARTVAIPAEIPVGIFTALIGGPGFLFLLRGVVRQQGGQA